MLMHAASTAADDEETILTNKRTGLTPIDQSEALKQTSRTALDFWMQELFDQQNYLILSLYDCIFLLLTQIYASLTLTLAFNEKTQAKYFLLVLNEYGIVSDFVVRRRRRGCHSMENCPISQTRVYIEELKFEVLFYLYWVLSEQGLWARTMMKTCWNWDLMFGMNGRAPGS